MNHTHPEDTVKALRQWRESCAEITEVQDFLTRDVLGRVSGRWPLWVLNTLAAAEGPMRFTRILEAVEGVTQKVLTQTLRHLERDGFVRRRVFPQIPPRVEYTLTPLGRELVTRVDPLIAWARTHVSEFEAARHRFDAGRDAPQSTPSFERLDDLS